MVTKNNQKEEQCQLPYGRCEQKLIELILGITNDTNRKSTLQLALESARFHCGIEKDNTIDSAKFICRQNIVERIINNEATNHYVSDEADLFTALLSYFICLEQIGSLFYTESKMKEGDSNGIVNAINIFSPQKLSKGKVQALKNLRNSLGHSYGLVNVNKSINVGTHKYSLNFKDDGKEVIKIPNKENTWDGNYLDKREKTSTIVYVFPLIRFIEKTIQNVVNEYYKGNLRFIHYEEIKSRYTIIV